MHKDMTQRAILERAQFGKTDIDDAKQLHRWLCPTMQEMIVKAYYAMVCNVEKVHEYLASDLREGLAVLITDEPE